MNNMFENKVINGYTYATRFIMSWIRMGGKLNRNGEGYDEFEEWLNSLELLKEDVKHIVSLAKNGKMELEASARDFIKNNIKH